MGKRIDITGQKFGEWVVLAKGRSVPRFTRSGSKSGSTLYWICRCSCGEEREVLGYTLNNGTTTSCGHKLRKDHHSSYIGEMFGLLTVQRTYTPKSGGARAECVCACGNTTEVIVQNLLVGTTKSCGCLREQASRRIMKSEGFQQIRESHKSWLSQHDAVRGKNGQIVSWKPKVESKL